MFRRYYGFDDTDRFARLMPDEGTYLRNMERRFQLQHRRRLEERARESRRRQVELEFLGRFVPAGPWDADCEAHPEQTYTWDLGAGFKGEIRRNRSHWTWCGYILLPEWYPFHDKDCDFWNGETDETAFLGIDKPPKNLTYGGNAERCYGFDHSWSRDIKPLSEYGPLVGGAYYTTYEKVVEEMWMLAVYFLDQLTVGNIAVPADVLEANKEGILRIREQEMRIRDNQRKERERKAAEEARIAAEKAAAEAAAAAARAAEVARLAAEAAERQRLWDEAHPEEVAIREAEKKAVAAAAEAAKAATEVAKLRQRAEDSAAFCINAKKRTEEIEQKIAEADTLVEREQKGETLTAREKRKIKHTEQLKVELRNRAGFDVNPKDYSAEIAEAEQKAAAAEMDAAKAAAELTALKEPFEAKQRAEAAAAAAHAAEASC